MYNLLPILNKLPNISKIIWVAFVVRISVLFLGHYFVDLPDSDSDAKRFVVIASVMAEGGLF